MASLAKWREQFKARTEMIGNIIPPTDAKGRPIEYERSVMETKEREFIGHYKGKPAFIDAGKSHNCDQSWPIGVRITRQIAEADGRAYWFLIFSFSAWARTTLQAGIAIEHCPFCGEKLPEP